MTISVKVSTRRERAGFLPGTEHTSDCTEMTAAGVPTCSTQSTDGKCRKWEALQIT